MSALVQISDMKYPDEGGRLAYFSNYPEDGGRKLSPLQIANRRRPKEVLALVEALTEMFKRIGMSEVCRACWAGELKGRTKGVACCGSCPLVGHEACLAKPTGCALYMCYDQTQRQFPRTADFLGALRGKLWELIHHGCYPGAVYAESRLKLNRPAKKILRVLRHAVDAWEEL